MHTYTTENSIFDGPITDLLSVLCILIEIFSRAHANVQKQKTKTKRKREKKAVMISDLALLLVIFRETVRQAGQ